MGTACHLAARAVAVSGFALTFLLAGCAGSEGEEPAASGEAAQRVAETQIRYVDQKVARLIARSQCSAGNGEHGVGTYDPLTFDAARQVEEIKALDARRECPGRKYSYSRENAVALFGQYIDEQRNLSLSFACDDERNPNAWRDLERELRALVGDPENRAVFTSLHDDAQDDDPVHCAYARVHVLRKNGTAIHFDFNWSD